ncbi:hypothetical protein [Clostridium beijerinckii]|uniref:Tail fiber protein n=1 Tax=Clostridium beijerinckii TaxID=1520 RepID=A0AAE5H944_CLOBE|nr:hypothetical protein [Clostridium beijerinckii]NSB16753.1 hypothetical protein [Clostridium beijerinckii]OOM19351.1 hypothetical protein CLOBE_53720 [Clostridium beijerinckii]
MLTTTNYGLKKPEGTDVVNIDDFNGNADIIDTKLKEINSALPLKAPLDSPGLTGAPTAPTQTAGDNSTKIANTAFVTTAVANKTSVSGNAGTATKLQTPRNIALAGDVTGSANFDGSGNISITATVADDSHNHIIANVDGLQSALDVIDTQLSDMAQDSYPTVIATGTNSYVGSTDKIKSLGKGTTKLTLFVGMDATGNCSLNLNSYGAKNIKDSFGNIVNNFKKDVPYNLCYNGTDFILQGKGGGGDALASQLLVNKKATVDTGPIVGTMPERGNITATLNAGQSYTIAEGHHGGGGTVTANSLASQTAANADASKILAGFSAWVSGSLLAGTATIASLGGFKYTFGTTGSISNSSQTVTIPGAPIIVFGIYHRSSTSWPFVYAANASLGIPTSGIYVTYLTTSISGNTIIFSNNGNIDYVSYVALYN